MLYYKVMKVLFFRRGCALVRVHLKLYSGIISQLQVALMNNQVFREFPRRCDRCFHTDLSKYPRWNSFVSRSRTFPTATRALCFHLLR